MDDAAFVGGFERGGDLSRDGEGFLQGNPERSRCQRVPNTRCDLPFPCEAIGERLALDKLQYQRGTTVYLLEALDGSDMGMVERRLHPRFLLEAQDVPDRSRKAAAGS
jgi:hypothetical protein